MEILTKRISAIWRRQDTNKCEFLILKFSSGEDILIFPRRVNEERWEQLREGEKYEFTVVEGRNDTSKLLIDFKIV